MVNEADLSDLKLRRSCERTTKRGALILIQAARFLTCLARNKAFGWGYGWDCTVLRLPADNNKRRANAY